MLQAVSSGIWASGRRQPTPNLIKEFDDFFKVWHNVIYKRAQFYKRNQHKGESIEQDITALYKLVETCEFKEFKKGMLRDRIVVGIQNETLLEQLQCDPELTQDKVKRIKHQLEAVKEQRHDLYC